MAPSSTSPSRGAKSLGKSTKTLISLDAVTSTSLVPVTMERPATELADIFKADLHGIKALVTCTICDQLLYEPWTLACGHTYCYSCLCNWFLPNNRSKSCPECRSSVKDMPAPAFVIKQLVEIVMSRVELMPEDESAEQHIKRQKEENQSVETDKNAIDGLFKGCFSRARLTNIRYDEDDRVHVCSHCGHEFTGSPQCENCGVDFEGEDEALRDDFSDLDEMEEMEFDLDEEELSENEEESLDWGAHFLDHPPFHSFIRDEEQYGARRPRVEEISSDDSEGDSDGTTTSSMRDFVIQDDGSRAIDRGSRPQIIDSDSDGSDEGGDVSNRRNRLPARRPPNRPIVVDSDSEAEGSVSVDSCGVPRRSESEDHSEEGYGRDSDGAVRDGWSPLDQDDDSESEEVDPFMANTRETGTDSDTTVGHQESDDEDDEDDDNTSRDDRSSTPRLVPAPDPPRRPWEGHGMTYTRSNDQNRSSARREQRRREQKDRERERERRERRERREQMEQMERANDRSTSVTTVVYDSSDNDETSTDHDGDVEMSVSPSANTSRESSRSVEVLGSANDFHDVDESSSEGSIQPANRRARPRQTAMAAASTQEYDPRISMMFAQHQSDLRDVTARESPFYEHRRDMSWRMEAPSRSRRRAQYSLEPPIQGSSTRPGQDSITISAPVRSRRAQRNHREYQA